MLKSKAKLFAMILLIFAILAFIIGAGFNTSYSKSDDRAITNWKIAIKSDAKDLNDTRKMNFVIQDDPNIAKGRIAPGSKAIATIEVDLRETTSPVEIITDVDKTNISSQLNLTAKIGNEEYEVGTGIIIKPENEKLFTNDDGIKVIELELEWDYEGNDDKLDTELGIMAGTISIPVTISVSSNI